jgi:hypothetical protein
VLTVLHPRYFFFASPLALQTALCALAAMTASRHSRAQVSGRAFFATDGWAGQIAEYFAPVLQVGALV